MPNTISVLSIPRDLTCHGMKISERIYASLRLGSGKLMYPGVRLFQRDVLDPLRRVSEMRGIYARHSDIAVYINASHIFRAYLGPFEIGQNCTVAELHHWLPGPPNIETFLARSLDVDF